MNKQPIYYMQTDPRWADNPYQVDGRETTNIRKSGCGPTAAAMLITQLACTDYTPDIACAEAKDHGFKAPNQGTYYGYFEWIFEKFGIPCTKLNGWADEPFAGSAYHKMGHPVHVEVRKYLHKGWYIIACMGKGRWTRSGHYVVVWETDGVVHINDPASGRKERLEGDPSVFFNEVKYYWAVDGRRYNRPTVPARFPAAVTCAVSALNIRVERKTGRVVGTLRRGDHVTVTAYDRGWYKTNKGWISGEYVIPDKQEPENKEEPDMSCTYEEWCAFQHRYEIEQAGQKAPQWAREKGVVEKAMARDLTDGTRPCSPASRVELMAVANAVLDAVPDIVANEVKLAAREKEKED